MRVNQNLGQLLNTSLELLTYMQSAGEALASSDVRVESERLIARHYRVHTVAGRTNALSWSSKTLHPIPYCQRSPNIVFVIGNHPITKVRV